MHRAILAKVNFSTPSVQSSYLMKRTIGAIGTIRTNNTLFTKFVVDKRCLTHAAASRPSMAYPSSRSHPHGHKNACRNRCQYSTIETTQPVRQQPAGLESSRVSTLIHSQPVGSTSTFSSSSSTHTIHASSTATITIPALPSPPTTSIPHSTILQLSPSPHALSSSSSSAVSPKSRGTKRIEKDKRDGHKNKSKNNHEWDAQLDALMISLHQDHGINWRTIGTLLDRPYTTIYSRYIVTVQPALRNGWVPPKVQDQTRLEQLVKRAAMMAQDKSELMRTRRKAKEEAAAAAKPTKERRERVTWDAALDQKIVDMALAGCGWPSIGLALNRPYSSCYSRYHTILNPAVKEPWSPEVVDRVDELVAQGVCWKLIGQELGILPISAKAKWLSLKRRNSMDNIDTEKSENLTLSRKSRIIKNNVNWIAFSKEEAAVIMSLVNKHRSDNWDPVLQDFQQHFIQPIPSESTAISSSEKPAKSNRQLKLANDRIMDITALDIRHQHSRIARSNRLWNFDQETVLIQQVLKHTATSGSICWETVARLTGLHTPQECRSQWKQLDMPINRTRALGWTKIQQSTFWNLWEQLGPNFERIAKLGGGGKSPEEVQRYFKAVTKGFPDPEQDPEGFESQIEELRAMLPSSRQKYHFTKERSLRLQRAMRFYSKQARPSTMMMNGTWQWIANKVQRGLGADACFEHWSYLNKNMDIIQGPLEWGKTFIKPETANSWSHEELKLLDQGIREVGLGWKDIQQQYLPWRTTRSIRQRYMIMSDKSATVSEEEYYTITEAGGKSVDIDYDALVQKMPGWNRSPCRRVFETSYKHLMETTVWLPEEDRLLIEKTLELKGRDWNAIAKHFDGIQPARAPLYAEAMARLNDNKDRAGASEMRTMKSAWQCRLRWCQLVEPLMPKERMLSIDDRSVTLKLSKQLLDQMPKSTA